jgi:hypothetical protein
MLGVYSAVQFSEQQRDGCILWLHACEAGRFAANCVLLCDAAELLHLQVHWKSPAGCQLYAFGCRLVSAQHWEASQLLSVSHSGWNTAGGQHMGNTSPPLFCTLLMTCSFV